VLRGWRLIRRRLGSVEPNVVSLRDRALDHSLFIPSPKTQAGHAPGLFLSSGGRPEG
jgi:hypothetical protein